MNGMDTVQPTANESEAGVRSPMRFALAGLILGILVEVLFFDHVPGISFGLWAAACVGTVLLAAMLERVSPSLAAGALALPVLVFSFFVALRLEPLSVFLDAVLTLFCLGWLVRSFRQGRLLDYGWIDMALAVLWTPLEAWIRPWGVLQHASRRLLGERAARSRALGVLRGILLALPLLIVFASLFASADLVFSDYVDRFLKWLNIDLLSEYLARLLLIVFSGVFLLGALVLALRDPGERPFIGRDRPLVPRFLGSIESGVILGGVDLLFLVFVAVQFGYLFGGHANITSAGYTYSEYARRGFFELVAAAALSFGLIYALAVITRRESSTEAAAFHGGALLLVLLTGAILVSAMVRLGLYEEAYGFTRLRTYTHVAIVWLGILSAAFLALLFTGRLRQSACLIVFGAMGFALTLNGMDVDAFIVRSNVARMERGGELDLPYLLSLSDDAVPGLVDLTDRASDLTRSNLLPALACRRATIEEWYEEAGWPSAHASRLRARDALARLEADLSGYRVGPGTGEYEGWAQIVTLPTGQQVPCYDYMWVD